jgi:hypothetical protein
MGTTAARSADKPKPIGDTPGEYRDKLNELYAPYRIEHRSSAAGEWWEVSGPGIAPSTYGAAAVSLTDSGFARAIAKMRECAAIFRAGVNSIAAEIAAKGGA